MTLIHSMMTPITRMRRVDVRPDGLFGAEAQYYPVGTFKGALLKDSSAEARLAERQALREEYTLVVPEGVALAQGDVIRRDSDGLTFRLTSNTCDGEAPAASNVRIARATCERWDIP